MIESGVDGFYLAAQRSFADLVRALGPDELAAGVPCSPEWTVRDVVSHVAGITDDVLNGRLDGVATDAWTAAQVERNGRLTVTELLDRWDEQAPGFASLLAAGGEVRPPIDCHAHEHDVRHALDRPGNRDSAVVNAAVESMVNGFGHPLAVHLADGRTLRNDVGAGEPATLSRVTSFEVFRSRLGRRTAAQVAAYDWSGPDDQVAAVQGDWFAFGPTDVPIVE